jgi:hypothetical protein
MKLIRLIPIALCLAATFSGNAYSQQRGKERLYDPQNPQNFIVPGNPTAGPNLLAADLIFNPAPRPPAPVAPVDITRADIQEQIAAYNAAVEANNVWNQENIRLRNIAIYNSPYRAFVSSAPNTTSSNSPAIVLPKTAVTSQQTSQLVNVQVDTAMQVQTSAAVATPQTVQYVVNGKEITSPVYKSGYATGNDYGGSQYVSTASKISPNQAGAAFEAANQDMKINDPHGYNLAYGRVIAAAQMAAMTPDQRPAFDSYQAATPDQAYINVNGSFVPNPNYTGAPATPATSNTNVASNQVQAAPTASDYQTAAAAKMRAEAQAELSKGGPDRSAQMAKLAQMRSSVQGAAGGKQVSGQEIANSSDYGCAVAICVTKPDEPNCQDTLNKLTNQLRRGGSYPTCNKG